MKHNIFIYDTTESSSVTVNHVVPAPFHWPLKGIVLLMKFFLKHYLVYCLYIRQATNKRLFSDRGSPKVAPPRRYQTKGNYLCVLIIH